MNQLIPVVVPHQGVEWTLYQIDDGEAYIRDIDWAERLGYERPRDIRELIKRLEDAGRLGKVVCRTVRQTPGSVGGRPATEFYLTEGQALKVAAKSETDYADAVLGDLIRVFLAWRRQELTGTARPSPATLRALIRDELRAHMPQLVEAALFESLGPLVQARVQAEAERLATAAASQMLAQPAREAVQKLFADEAFVLMLQRRAPSVDPTLIRFAAELADHGDPVMPGHRSLGPDIMPLYRRWSRERGFPEFSSQRVAKALEAVGFQKDKGAYGVMFRWPMPLAYE